MTLLSGMLVLLLLCAAGNVVSEGTVPDKYEVDADGNAAPLFSVVVQGFRKIVKGATLNLRTEVTQEGSEENDVSGGLADQSTNSSTFELAVKGVAYLVKKEADVTEDGKECKDNSEDCEKWAKETYDCLLDDYMAEKCPKSCLVCFEAGTHKIKFGVEQLLQSEDEDEAVDVELVKEVVWNAAKYIIDEVYTDPNYAHVRMECYNDHAKCSIYAALARCDDEDGDEYIHKQCAPACRTCHMLEEEEEEGRDGISDYTSLEEYQREMKATYPDFYTDKFDWKTQGTAHDMWYHLGCHEIFKSERPIHSQSAWEEARALYKSLAIEENNTLSDDHSNGFAVEFEAKQSPGKGRGIFAAKDIKKGNLIYQSKQAARFDNGPAYRKFILGLETGFACDVLQWAFMQDLGDDTNHKYLATVDLDEGCFCNDGGWTDSGPNVGCDEDIAKEFPGKCKTNFFALRDIKAGEELLCDYSHFVAQAWQELGLAL